MRRRHTILLICATIVILGVLASTVVMLVDPICCGVEPLGPVSLEASRDQPILISFGQLSLREGETKDVTISVFAPQDLVHGRFTIGPCVGWNNTESAFRTSQDIPALKTNESVTFETTIEAAGSAGKYTCLAELIDDAGEPILSQQFVAEIAESNR